MAAKPKQKGITSNLQYGVKVEKQKRSATNRAYQNKCARSHTLNLPPR